MIFGFPSLKPSPFRFLPGMLALFLGFVIAQQVWNGAGLWFIVLVGLG
ncbi:hypothetical protein [Streptomyces sp. NPDC058401]